MCRPSKVAVDWIVKGCHIHVNGVELAVRPDHRGGIVFKKVFRSVPPAVEAAALRAAVECLADDGHRLRWIRDIERAMVFLRSESGQFAELARGRAGELKFLLVALRRFGVG